MKGKKIFKEIHIAKPFSPNLNYFQSPFNITLLSSLVLIKMFLSGNPNLSITQFLGQFPYLHFM